MNPGEYIQPFPRKTLVQVPVVSGWVTSRLRAVDAISPGTSGEDTTVTVTFENVSNTAFSVLLRQTDDKTTAGTRHNVISGIALVAGGRRTVSSDAPYMPFLELYCYSGGPGNIRMQIESQRRWEQMGFDKVDDETFYPPELWEAGAYPTAPEFPES